MSIGVDEAIPQLQNILQQGKLVVFAGSGISVGSGLPTWDDLLVRFIDLYEKIEGLLPDDQKVPELLADAKTQASKYPTRVASVLKKRIKFIQEHLLPRKDINGIFKDFFGTKLFSGKSPNINHRLIVTTNYPFILTTNYDRLLEDAAEEAGCIDLLASSFSFNEADKFASALYEGDPSIIHVHGDTNDVALDDFVFTAEDYQSIRRKYSGFTVALQSVFVNYSVLFVGYGGSDPHLEDFVEEMSYLLGWSKLTNLPTYFLPLLKGKTGDVLNEYKKTLRTDIIVLENYDEITKLLDALQKTSPRKCEE